MKEFSKYVLATITGTIITAVISAVLILMSVVGIISSGEAKRAVKDNSVLVLDLSGTVSERSSDNPVASFLGKNFGETGLNDILSAIRKAGENDRIKGIYIGAGTLSAGYSTLTEIRNALLDFRKTGKWIVAYCDACTQGAYYVASAADKIYLSPSGEIDLHGISSQTMYVRDLYEKFGIRFQIVKVGKYKSATEAYSGDSMSEANREQVTAFVTGIWNAVVSAIAESRGITKDEVNAVADRFAAFIPQEDILKASLADSLAYSDGVKAAVRNRLGLGEGDEINQLSVSDMRSVKDSGGKGGLVAVYYAEGSIVDDDTETVPSLGGPQIVATKVCADLDDLIDDDDVKAVVLRVNSPGGSASASEQIWHRVALLREKKPVVVSMGDYAASGGYYISCGASWIVAQPTTLTGSIGIFGIVPEASDLLTNKLSLHFDGVKTNAHADFGQGLFSYALRPLTADETDLLTGYIRRGYSLFRRRVAQGRGRSEEEIEEIAQGHVWTGRDALAVRLVDQLGGLDDAVEKAAELAGLDECYTEDYPEEESWYDMLFGSDDDGGILEARTRAFLGDWYQPLAALRAAGNQRPVQAMMPFFLSVN